LGDRAVQFPATSEFHVHLTRLTSRARFTRASSLVVHATVEFSANSRVRLDFPSRLNRGRDVARAQTGTRRAEMRATSGEEFPGVPGVLIVGDIRLC
jgi:hypothetical protein